jgi:hypothetical protein
MTKDLIRASYGRHFHIRWSGQTCLDWQPFESRAEANAEASHLARPGEIFSIEAVDETCPQCIKFKSGKAS